MWLSDIFKVNISELLKETFKNFFDSDLDTYAAALAFQMLFALIPFIILFIAILGLLDLRDVYQTLYEHAGIVIPGEASEIIDQFVAEIEQPNSRLIPLALLVALWIASSAMRSAIHALNIAYKVKETRRFWFQLTTSIAYTLAITVMLILAMAFMIVSPQVLEWIAGLVSLDDVFIAVWTWARWFVAMILLMATISFIYYAAPNVNQKLRNIIPGSVLSVLVWIGLSLAFDFYMRTFIDLNILFGGLGAIIFLMIYFYICAAVLLFGAELNAVIEQRMASGS